MSHGRSALFCDTALAERIEQVETQLIGKAAKRPIAARPLRARSSSP